MNQPTAQQALMKLEPLIGEWTLQAIPPGGEPWPGEARATMEWHDSGAHVVQRSTVEMPEAPMQSRSWVATPRTGRTTNSTRTIEASAASMR
jgi:hypothetical protein